MTPKADRDELQKLEALRQRAGREEPTPLEMLQFWDVVRNFSENQVKAALTDLPQGNGNTNRTPASAYLTMMLFQRWARLDPDSAELAIKVEPFKDNQDLLWEVMMARIARDPDGAMRWLEKSGSSSMKRTGSMFIGGLLMRNDPVTGLKKAAAMGDDALGAALRTLARDMAGTAESRNEFYALAEEYGDRKEWDSILYSVGSAAAEHDAEELLDSLKDAGLPAEPSAKLRDQALRMLFQTDPGKAMDWSITPDSGISREKQLSQYSGWAAGNSNEAIDWAVRNGRQDFIAESVKNESKGMMQRSWDQWSGGSTQDRWINGIVDRYQAWRTHDAGGAESWAQSMPADIRSYLNGKTKDAAK